MTFIRKLTSFQPRPSYAQEIFDNDRLAGLAGVVPLGPRGILLAADILYVTVRNFGVLTLAERGIHAFAFGSVIDGLEAECLLMPGAARALTALRFLKCLYRSGESGNGVHVRSTLQSAITALPRDHFPSQIRVVSPKEVLLAPAPLSSMPAYFQLRDLERRFIALQALHPSHPREEEIQALSRWIENPRAYANLSSRLAPELRDIMARRATNPIARRATC